MSARKPCAVERRALALVEIALALFRDDLLPETLNIEEVKCLIVDPALWPDENPGGIDASAARTLRRLARKHYPNGGVVLA